MNDEFSELEAVSFTNTLKEPFRGQYSKKELILQPGEQRLYPKPVAMHLRHQLVDQAISSLKSDDAERRRYNADYRAQFEEGVITEFMSNPESRAPYMQSLATPAPIEPVGFDFTEKLKQFIPAAPVVETQEFGGINEETVVQPKKRGRKSRE